MASVARYCCCGCTPADDSCTHCSAGITPASFNVVFSGVTFCTDCLTSAFGVDVKSDVAAMEALVNQSHQLDQDGSDACSWAKRITNGWTGTEYTTDTCATAIGAISESMEFRISKTASNEWFLRVQTASWGLIYSDTFTGGGAGVCQTVPASTSELVAGDCGNEMAYGGSATVTCG